MLFITFVLALASEERTRQMKVRTFRTSAPSSTSQDLERALKNKREVSGLDVIFMYTTVKKFGTEFLNKLEFLF